MDNNNNAWFCSLFITTKQNQKVNTSIEISQDPRLLLAEKNKKKINYSSDGEEKEPWKHELIVGPMNKETAIKFQAKWKNQSRGIASRKRKGIEMAIENKFEIGDQRKDSLENSSTEEDVNSKITLDEKFKSKKIRDKNKNSKKVIEPIYTEEYLITDDSD